MKKKIFFVLILFYFIFSTIVLKNVFADTNNFTFYIPIQIPTTTDDFVKRIVGLLLYLVPIIALFVIVYAAYLFITSRGDPKQIEKAKKMIVWAIIGTAATLLAYSIKELIVKFFTQ